MANRRCFNKAIMLADEYIDMPATAKALYVHLNLLADDDGLVNNCKSAVRGAGASADDLQELIDNGYLLQLDNGVIAITHWLIHNSIRKDRYCPSRLQERLQLSVDETGRYTIWQPTGNQLSTNCQPGGIPNITKYNLNKYNSTQYKLSNIDAQDEPEPQRNGYGELCNVYLSDYEFAQLGEKLQDRDRLIDELSIYIAKNGDKYKSHYATLISWDKRQQAQPVASDAQAQAQAQAKPSYDLEKHQKNKYKKPIFKGQSTAD